MKGTSNQFLSGSGFTKNQDRGIRFRDLCYLRQHTTYRLGGAYDFLEHRRVIDFLSQREVLLARSFLRLFAIVDVGTGRIPADDLSLFVQQRLVLDQEPTILTVLAPGSLFILKWNPSGECHTPFIAQSLHIFRMKNASTKVVRHHLFSRQAGVLHYCLIRVEIFSVRPQSGDELRYGVDDRSKLSLRFLDFLDGLCQRGPCSFSLNRDYRDVAGSLDQLEIALTRDSRFGVVHGEGAEQLLIFREQRLRPSCPQSVP